LAILLLGWNCIFMPRETFQSYLVLHTKKREVYIFIALAVSKLINNIFLFMQNSILEEKNAQDIGFKWHFFWNFFVITPTIENNLYYTFCQGIVT